MTVATQGFTITGERSDLLATLTPAERFVSRHGTNLAVNGIHIKGGTDGGYIEATNLTMSYRGHLWGTVDDDVDVVVHPRLRRAVQAMAEGPVSIRQEGGELEVTGKGKARYTASLLDASFPNAFPDHDTLDWKNTKPVDVSEALSVMAEASKYAARKEQNPSITGVNLRVKENAGKAHAWLVVDATDGYRLYQNQIELPAGGFPFNEDEVILPVAMVTELTKLFPSGEVRFAASTNLFYASDANGETLFASRRIGGKFPDVDKMAPDFQQNATLPQQETEKALERLRGVAGDKPATVEITGQEMRLSARGDGEAEEWVTLSQAVSEDLTVGFNLEHLHSALQLFRGEDEVRFSFASPLRPARFDTDGDRHLIIMPVRVS